MKKLTSLFLSLVLLAALTTGISAEGVSGIYKATAQGYMGYVTVYVTLEDGAIASVEIGQCTDMPENIAQVACDILPAAIVEAQSVNVDSVSGATFTSAAIKNAASQALREAGVYDSFKQKVTAVAEPIEDAEVDVLVIGGGMTGEQAALNAKYPGYEADNGLSVMLVERQAFLGGSSMLAGGYYDYIAPLNDNSNMNNEQMMQDFWDFMRVFSGGDEGNHAAMRAMYEISGDTLLRMQANGYSLISKDAMAPADTYSSLDPGGITGLNSATIDINGYDQHGVVIQHFFAEKLRFADIDVRLNTRATELIVEDGAVIGAVMEHQGQSYNVRAKKVVLATGGMLQNKQLLSEIAPDWAGVYPFANGGDTGDAITLTRDLDTVVGGSHTMMSYLSVDWRFGPYAELSSVARGRAPFVVVNRDGNRFMNDANGFNYASVAEVVKQPGSAVYAILDANHPLAAEVSAYADKDYVYTADTLASLAEQAGIAAEVFQETVQRYNDNASAGTDDSDFGVSAAQMIPVAEGPFYAVRLIATACANYDGLEVNERFEVLNASGEAIPNLYCGGEAAHTGSYSTLAAALFSGRLIGEEAAEAILN